MINNLLIAIHVFPMHILTSLSVDEILLQRYVNNSINFRDLPFNMEIALSFLKHMNSVLSEFTLRSMPLATCSRLCIRFGLGRYNCEKYMIICVVCICESFCGISFASFVFSSIDIYSMYFLICAFGPVNVCIVLLINKYIPNNFLIKS